MNTEERTSTNIVAATLGYEQWLSRHTRIVINDLQLKHERMRESPFVFLRATFYRWLQLWPKLCPREANAHAVLSVGDVHTENFGTWRDAEGRLAWGINDVDEACVLPYTNDLVRLAASVLFAIRERWLAISDARACQAILEGYTRCLAEGGQAIVLAERHVWLRDIAVAELRDPRGFLAEAGAAAAARRGSVARCALRALPRVAARPGGALHGSAPRRRCREPRTTTVRRDCRLERGANRPRSQGRSSIGGRLCRIGARASERCRAAACDVGAGPRSVFHHTRRLARAAARAGLHAHRDRRLASQAR